MEVSNELVSWVMIHVLSTSRTFQYGPKWLSKATNSVMFWAHDSSTYQA